ncbi:MAG: hypothetical protein U5K56_01610 [Halioglobus sp.]|nr:hypothetical protein [Halioglobus sp.]
MANTDGDALGDCIDDAEPGSDVLVVKGLRGVPISNFDPPANPLPAGEPDDELSFPNTPVTATPGPVPGRERRGGRLLDSDNTMPDVGLDKPWGGGQGLALQLPDFLYPVDQGSRTAAQIFAALSRKRLEPNPVGGMRVGNTEDLVRGVEDMRVRFYYASTRDSGIDDTGYEDDVEAVDIAGGRTRVAR